MEWYEQYLGGAGLAPSEKNFLSQYTQAEFANDYYTIFPEQVGVDKVTIKKCVTMMMTIANKD
ncbi:hypothetical protein NVP1042O_06 [Vibrio phage 1.042.O._10N.286.45.B8]|nr:hypothetical protein NVP1042O_06 [Vibrio phage 1.042.O._10N.286.45.B8]